MDWLLAVSYWLLAIEMCIRDRKRGIGCANKQMAELATRQNLADRLADDAQ